MKNKWYVGSRVSDFERYNEIGPVDGIRLVVDEEHEYRSGNMGGYVMEIQCPYGSQRMADNMLASVKGNTYKGFSASNAILSPRAELGDGVTVNKLYSMLAYRSVTFGPGHMSDISAPAENELEHEYPYMSGTQGIVERQLAKMRSTISKTSEEIRLEVEGIDGRVSSLQVTIDGVTIEDESGKTLIKGSSIDTGSLNLSGAITFGDLDSSTQEYIGNAYSRATSARDIVSSWAASGSGATTYIDGEMIMTGTVTAAKIEGLEINIFSESGQNVGNIRTYEATSYSGRSLSINSPAISIIATSEDGAAFFGKNLSGKAWLEAETNVRCYKNFIPYADVGGYSLGMSNYRWDDIYSNNSHITTSDETEKSNIKYDTQSYDSLFDSLSPCTFEFKNNGHGRRHMGLLAQEVENSMNELGISSLDFAAFIKSPGSNPDEYTYGLRYGELIPLLISQVQSLKSRVKVLEGA